VSQMFAFIIHFVTTESRVIALSLDRSIPARLLSTNFLMKWLVALLFATPKREQA
jgi:hypothetical protein